jgi:anti-sigma-K factor RskA
MNTTSKEAHKREEIEALLPWHAAGTLSRRDAQRVEEALTGDRELAREYAQVREELAETIRLNETLGAPSVRAMERLFAAIEAESPRQQSRSLNIGARLAEFIAGFSPRTLAVAASAAALALVLQAGVITSMLVSDEPHFGTASHGISVEEREGATAFIRFSPQITAGDITKFLQANKGTTVEGPKAEGLYQIRVMAGDKSKEELARITKQMQQDKLVISVFP